MACSSCGQPRTQMSRNSSAPAPRASSMTNNVKTVDSLTLNKNKVQGAVASNPNKAPSRTKV